MFLFRRRRVRESAHIVCIRSFRAAKRPWFSLLQTGRGNGHQVKLEQTKCRTSAARLSESGLADPYREVHNDLGAYWVSTSPFRLQNNRRSGSIRPLEIPVLSRPISE